MNVPELYITDNLPSFESLQKNVFHVLDVNKENKNTIEQYVLSLAYLMLNKQGDDTIKFEVQYSYNPDIRLLTDSTGISCVTFLNDCSNNAFVTTNIDKDMLKFKEFNERCKLYLSSVLKNYVICSMSNTFHTMLGTNECNLLCVNILFGDKYNNEFSFENKCDKYKFVNKDLDKISVNRDIELKYECFNDIVHGNTLAFNFEEITKQGGLFELSEYSNDMGNYKSVLSDIGKLSKNDLTNNRFSSRNVIKGVFTPVTCDWISQSIREISNTTKTQLHPNKTGSICDYVKFFVDHWLMLDFFKFYNIPSEMFAFHVSNITFCDITTTDTDVLKPGFIMDIAFTDINGDCHKFKDGTCSHLSKGDGIIYASDIINSSNSYIGVVTVLRIEFMISPKKKSIVTEIY